MDHRYLLQRDQAELGQRVEAARDELLQLLLDLLPPHLRRQLVPFGVLVQAHLIEKVHRIILFLGNYVSY